MSRSLLFFAFLLLPRLAFSAGSVKMNLSDAISNHSVNVTAVNFLGNYNGKTTKLTVSNNTKSMLEITVNLGVLLKPEDSAYQPMLLAGQEVLALMPHASGEVIVQTFCGNSPRRCPSKDLKYSFSKVVNDTIVKVLQFMKANSFYGSAGQHAVWAMTNHDDLSGIYDEERSDVSKKLIELIVSLTGRPRPEYYTVSRDVQVPGAPAYVPKTLKIIAQFEIRLDAPKTMTLGVYDSLGNMAQPVFENQQFGKSGHRFEVEFEAENVPAGRYYIRLKEGDMVLQEKMVKVD